MIEQDVCPGNRGQSGFQSRRADCEAEIRISGFRKYLWVVPGRTPLNFRFSEIARAQNGRPAPTPEWHVAWIELERDPDHARGRREAGSSSALGSSLASPRRGLMLRNMNSRPARLMSASQSLRELSLSLSTASASAAKSAKPRVSPPA